MKLEKELSFKFGCYYDSETQEDCFNKISLSFLPDHEDEVEKIAIFFKELTSNKSCSELIEEIAGEPTCVPLAKALIFSKKMNRHQLERIYYYYKASKDVCEAFTFMGQEYIPEEILAEILERYPEFQRNL